MPNKTLLGISAHVDGAYRKESLLGRAYIVVPVVALVEGVLQGMSAKTPELALAEEFGRFPDGWNGRPVVMGHPVQNGVPVSANSPPILKDYLIGTIFNARLESKKLKLEAWVEVDRAKTLNTNSKATLTNLQDGDMIEVSTAYFTQLEDADGEYNGRDYHAIQRNVVPDHLAFLPNGTKGACSNKDGCGAPRINSAEFAGLLGLDPKFVGDVESRLAANGAADSPTEGASLIWSAAVADIPCNCGTCPDCKTHAHIVAQNDQYLTEFAHKMANRLLSRKMRQQTDPKSYNALVTIANSFPDGMMSGDAQRLIGEKLRVTQKNTYVLGLTPNKVVYEQFNQTTGYYETYQQSYEVSSDGKVTLANDAERVTLVTHILPKVAANSQEPNMPTNIKTPKDKTPINNSGGDGTNDLTELKAPEKGTLKTFSTETTDFAIALNEAGEVIGAVSKPKAGTTTATDITDPANNTTGKDGKSTSMVIKALDGSEVEVTMNEKGETISTKLKKAGENPFLTPNEKNVRQNAKPQTVTEYISQAPSDIQEVLNYGMKAHSARKGQLVKALSDTGRCKFTKDQLTAKSVEELETLAELADVPTYEGVALPHSHSEQREDEDAPPPAPVCFSIVEDADLHALDTSGKRRKEAA